MSDADVIVVGGGLAGLVTTAELADAGRRVILLDQEPEASLGGQAFWSFGGLFFVNSPEQRRVGIRDSPEVALQDWLGSAGFDRPEDAWPRRWAEAHVEFAAGEKRQWLSDQGVRFFPTPGWAERGGYLATGHGNSVPRFHITWGTEGIENWSPIWTRHGIRILPGPSSLWFDACGRRLPVPLFPGFDTLGTLEHLRKTGHDYSWFVLTQKIIEREFALSGSEQNPDLTGRNVRAVITSRGARGAPPPVEAFKRHGTDFIVAHDLGALVRRMNALTGDDLLDPGELEREITARDRELENPYSKDLQITAIRGARRYIPDRLSRVARPHRLLDAGAGPLIAVRLWILTRKTLGGLETDLSSRVLKPGGEPLDGLYAAGEVAGSGGGGMHGYRSLEGTFLGGCLFSGRTAGRAVAQALS